MSFDINKLTIGEIRTAERIGDSSITLLNDPTASKAGMLMGLAYVITKRTDPTFTVAQAETLTLAECSALIGGDDDEDDDPKASNENEPTQQS